MPVYVRGMGTVQAYNAVTVKSRVDGQIVKVDFTEGQEVKAGDPLFEIDPRPFAAALAQARANKERDEAQLGSAEADLQRYERLVGNGYQTRQSYDQQKGLVGQLQGAVKADQAQIESAQLNLQYATIRSPIDGRTGARLVDAGNLVRAADNGGLVTITQLRPIFVSFTVPQGELDTIRRNQSKAPLAVEALSQSDEHPLATGKLTLIDNQIDQTTGTLHLKAAFDNQDEALWPGEFVDVRLVVSTRKDAVTLAARAVQRGPRGDYVFVIKPDMTVEMRIIEVAEVEDGVAVVEKGLEAGERVVVDGQYRLEQGTKVAVQPPAGREGG
jgi:multidrug efflux system membrane fusion protein